MKRISLIMATLVISSAFVFGQSKEEQAVRQTLNEIAAALRSQDVTSLDRVYGDGYTFVSPSGIMYNKSQRLASIKSGKPFESFDYEDVKVRIYGNTAVVNTNVRNKQAGLDPAVSHTTITMVKNGGRWQIVAAQGTPASTEQSAASDEQTLMQIEQELNDASIKGDLSARERYLSDSYIFTNPLGTTINKSQGDADMKSGELKFESSKIDDMKVQFYGNTAVVTFGRNQKGTFHGTDISGQYRTTHVFVKQNGRWQMVAGQSTRIATQ